MEDTHGTAVEDGRHVAGLAGGGGRVRRAAQNREEEERRRLTSGPGKGFLFSFSFFLGCDKREGKITI